MNSIVRKLGVLAFTVTAGCIGLGIIAAQDSNDSQDRLTQIAKTIVDEEKLPGMIVATMDDGKLVASGCAGIRKVGEEQAITLQDKFHIGSCSKAMTATLMAILVQEGKLQWTTTVGEIFPDYRGKIHDDFLAVTLSQLLAHRGGLPANAPNWELQTGDIVASRDQIMIQSLAKPPAHPPNSKFLYSNVGYVLAGHMAEKLLGKSWEEIIREKLFDPLQMTSAGFGPPHTAAQVDQPWGHHMRGASAGGGPAWTAIGDDNPPALGPAGTIHCTVEDWAKFLEVHIRPDAHTELLSPEQVAILHTPFESDAPRDRQYASGWIVAADETTRETVLGHSGSNTAWLATVRLYPQRGEGYIAITNLGGNRAQKATDRAIAELMKLNSAKK